MAHQQQLHQQQQQQYAAYAGPSTSHASTSTGIAPQDTTQQQQQQQTQVQTVQHLPGGGGAGPAPLVATGDWTKDLVHLAKTAELKKHALTLQLHTAHILSAHASLEQKSKAIQDIREQKNKLESERNRLLNCLVAVNKDRDKADLMEVSIDRECVELRLKINTLTEGDYTVAKRDVDRLRVELGQQPLPSLQSTLDEKSAQYLNERRLNGNGDNTNTSSSTKRAAGEVQLEGPPGSGKRPRGRPKGSKNRTKGGSGGGSGGGSVG